ncbi:MAG: NUDIX domain-containing protein [Minicystis sp.]
MASSPDGAAPRALPAHLDRPVIGVGGVVFETIEGETGESGPRVLLIQRAHPPAQGRWSLPGGRVERGELLSDALAREIAEETGLVVAVGALIEVVELLDPEHHFVVLDYLCERRGGALRAGDDASDARFVAVSELVAYGCTEMVIAVVQRAMEMEMEIEMEMR